MGWVAITEADIENYSGMYLRKGEGVPDAAPCAPTCRRTKIAREASIRAMPWKRRRRSAAHGAC